MDYINQMMEKLSKKHIFHLEMYGDNTKRLTGVHETSDPTIFSSGAGNRAASVRIPTSTAAANGKGYVEDRRPASDIDPYIVGAALVDTTLLDESLIEPMYHQFKEFQQWRKNTVIEE